MQIANFAELDLSKIELPIITVYFNTKDFPGKYVARLFEAPLPTKYHVVADSLEEVRKSIPYGRFSRLDRSEVDDPVIVEIWI